MIFVFTASHPLAGTKVISEPDGWKGIVFTLERHPDFNCLIEYATTALAAYGKNGSVDGGLDYFLSIEETYGPDEEISINIKYSDSDSDEDLETLFNGSLPIGSFNESIKDGHILEFGLTPSNFWTRFIGRAELPVDLMATEDLDGNAVPASDYVNLLLPSQPINEVASFDGRSGDANTAEDCYIATTGANIVLNGHQIIDGQMTYDQMRVLVKDQADPRDNGIRLASAGAWVRSIDANTNVEVENLLLTVTNGLSNAGKSYRQTTTGVVLGTSNIVFVQTNYIDVTKIWDGPGIQGPGTVPVSTNGIIRYATLSIHKIQDEIKDSFELSNQVLMPGGYPAGLNNTPTNVADVTPVIEVADVGGGITKIEFDYSAIFYFAARFKLFSGGSQGVQSCTATIKIYVDVNGVITLLDTNTQTVNTGVPIIPAADFAYRQFNLEIPIASSVSSTITIAQSDIVKYYAEYIFKFNYYSSNPSNDLSYSDQTVNGGLLSTDLAFRMESIFLPSSAQGFLIHDVGARIVRRTAGNGNCFYSPIIGSTKTIERQYSEEGSYWHNFMVQGLQLKQYSLAEKAYSISFLDYFKGISTIYPLGLKPGNRVLNGVLTDTIEIVDKNDLFRTDEISVYLANVFDIKRSYDPKYYPKGVKIEYKDWLSSDVQGIDDPQSERTLLTMLKQIGELITITIPIVAASLAIEKVRRLTKSNKNQDNQYDDKSFIIALNRGAVPLTPSLMEKFTSITNLLNPDKRYNIEHSCMRVFLRHKKFLQGGLQNFLGRFFNFSEGQGNDSMVSTMVDNGLPESYGGVALAEDGNIVIDNDYAFIPKPYIITAPLTKKEYSTIKTNKEKALGVSQTSDNFTPFIIQKLDWTAVEGVVEIVAYPKKEFKLKTPESNDVPHENIGNVFSDEFAHPPFS